MTKLNKKLKTNIIKQVKKAQNTVSKKNCGGKNFIQNKKDD